MRSTALGAALYLVLAVAMLYPQSLSPADTVWFVGDPLDSAYFLGWNAHQVLHDPWNLFDANILFPHDRAALFDTPRLLSSVLAAPAIWLTGNVILGYNLALILIYTFDALAGCRLAALLGCSRLGSWAAGALYAFNTYQISESPRVNTVFHAFLPLAVGELLQFLRTGQRRRAWHVGGLMLLQGFADQYQLVYGALVLACVTVVALALDAGVVAKRLRGLLAPAAVAALLYSPISLAYVDVARIYGFQRERPQGIELRHYLATSPTNVFYGEQHGPARAGRMLGPHFVGFVALALAALALGAWALRRGYEPPGAVVEARASVPAAALLALVCVALSLGPDVRLWGLDLPGPYRLLYDYVPGFNFLRLPERLGLVAMLFVGLLAGRGLGLIERRPRCRPLAWVLAILLPLEHLSPLPDTVRLPVGPEVPRVYGWLAANEVKAVAELPLHGEGVPRLTTLDEYFSTYHFRPIVHGYTTYTPLLTIVLERLLETFPSAASIDALRRVGVDTVVVHHGRLRARDLPHRLVAPVQSGDLLLRARFEGRPGGVHQGGLDEVFSVQPGTLLPAAPFPEGLRVRDDAWRWRSSRGDASLAGDGDAATAWFVDDLSRFDFLEVRFRRALRVAGIVIPMDMRTRFPTGFSVRGRAPGGRFEEIARFDAAHHLQLIDQLLLTPGQAELGIALGDRELVALSLALRPGDASFSGWSVSELWLVESAPP